MTDNICVGIKKDGNPCVFKTKFGKFCGKHIKQEISIIETKTSEDINKDIKKDINKDIKKDINKDIKKDINKDINKDIKKDIKISEDIKTDNKTNVVNVKVGHIRPKYDNLSIWVKDPNNVYIGRKGIVFIDSVRFPKEDSIWANPFKINSETLREDVIVKYESYIRDKIENGGYKEALLSLKGKTLGCWCKPDTCHGDLLIKLIDEYSTK